MSKPRIIYPRPNPPCKNCANRLVGCHASCEKYTLFHEEREKQKTELRREYVGKIVAEDYEIKEKLKNKKLSRRK